MPEKVTREGVAALGHRWVVRDDVPASDCSCAMSGLGYDHSGWCPTARHPGGTFYYAGRDLEGRWWMDVASAATFSFRAAQAFIRELDHPRRLKLERTEAERVAA